MSFSRIKLFFPLLFILLFGMALYYQALFFDYVWDDTLIFITNVSLLSKQLSTDIIFQPVLPGTTYFRPLIFLTWYWEFRWFGQQPVVSHAINIFIYLANIGALYTLAYFLAKKLQKPKPVWYASIAAWLYTIHPALIETTAWVSGRFDLLVTFFVLLASVIYVSSDVTKKLSWQRLTGLNLCFFLALLSKELAVVLPAILFCLYLVVCSKSNSWQEIFKNFIKLYWPAVLSLLFTFAAYMALRIYAMQHVYHVPMSWDYITAFILDRKYPLYALTAYVMQSLLPFYTIAPLHPVEYAITNSIGQWLQILVTFGIVLGIIYAAIARRSSAAWLAMAALISILPVIYLLPITIANNLFHERFMTLGLAFSTLALVFTPYVHIFNKLKLQLQRFIVVAVLLVWSGLAVATVHNILPFWRSDLALWHWMYKTYPNDALSRYSYWYGLIKDKQFQKVKELAEQYQHREGALSVDLQIMYANALLSLKDPESLNYIQGIFEVLPKFHERSDQPRRAVEQSRINLTALQIGGLYDSAATGYMLFDNDLNKALEYNYIAEKYLLPTENFAVLYKRAAILYAMGKYAEAKSLYQKLIQQTSVQQLDSKYSVNELLNAWCETKTDAQACQHYRAEKPFQP